MSYNNVVLFSPTCWRMGRIVCWTDEWVHYGWYPAQIIPDIYYCTTTKLMVKSSQSCIFAVHCQSGQQRQWWIHYHWTRLALSGLDGFVRSPGLVEIWYCCSFLQLLSSTGRLSHLFYEPFLAKLLQNNCKEVVGATIFNSLFMHSNLRPCFVHKMMVDGPSSGLTIAAEHY